MTQMEKVYLLAFTPLFLILFGIYSYRAYKYFRHMR